jgi:hypothetical protein
MPLCLFSLMQLPPPELETTLVAARKIPHGTMARKDWNEVGRERETARHRFPRINAAWVKKNAAWRSGPGQGFLMLRREKRAQLVKNIIAESERVIEFGEHASIHTSRQSCSKARKARIFALVWESSGESRFITGSTALAGVALIDLFSPWGQRPQGEGSP